LAPGTHSLRANFMGPLPMYSVICWNGSVFAIRSGMMKPIGVLFLPSANRIFG
jgi:hypothetical protein